MFGFTLSSLAHFATWRGPANCNLCFSLKIIKIAKKNCEMTQMHNRLDGGTERNNPVINLPISKS